MNVRQLRKWMGAQNLTAKFREARQGQRMIGRGGLVANYTIEYPALSRRDTGDESFYSKAELFKSVSELSKLGVPITSITVSLVDNESYTEYTIAKWSV